MEKKFKKKRFLKFLKKFFGYGRPREGCQCPEPEPSKHVKGIKPESDYDPIKTMYEDLPDYGFPTIEQWKI